KKILETIELFLKKDIYHLIEYEKKIAFEANIIKSSEEFINSLSNSQEWQNYFFKEYDIKNYFDIQLKKIFLLIEEILTCLSNDILLLNLKDKVLCQIDVGMGDFHNDSATYRLNFTDNTGIYYKPRSLEIDNPILKLGEEIERRLDRKIFYKVKNINRGNYGWSFPVKENQCQSYDEVKEYYYNMGILTSLSYFLNIEDLIYDNIISVGTKIALIDLECSLCVPRKINKTSQFVLDSISGRLFRNSVINSGIIPRFTYEDRYNDGQSDASLSYIQERKGFYNKLTFNETRVKFEIIHTQIKEKENHIPHYKNIPQPIEPYVNFYLKGFKNSFGFFLKNKKL